MTAGKKESLIVDDDEKLIVCWTRRDVWHGGSSNSSRAVSFVLIFYAVDVAMTTMTKTTKP